MQLPIHDGLIGILPNHASMVSVLGFGLLTLRNSSGEEEVYVVDGGFMEIMNNRVSVLANSAEKLSEVDFEQARKDFEAAQGFTPRGDEEVELRLEKIAAARTRIKNAG